MHMFLEHERVITGNVGLTHSSYLVSDPRKTKRWYTENSR